MLFSLYAFVAQLALSIIFVCANGWTRLVLPCDDLLVFKVVSAIVVAPFYRFKLVGESSSTLEIGTSVL